MANKKSLNINFGSIVGSFIILLLIAALLFTSISFGGNKTQADDTMKIGRFSIEQRDVAIMDAYSESITSMEQMMGEVNEQYRQWIYYSAQNETLSSYYILDKLMSSGLAVAKEDKNTALLNYFKKKDQFSSKYLSGSQLEAIENIIASDSNNYYQFATITAAKPTIAYYQNDALDFKLDSDIKFLEQIAKPVVSVKIAKIDNELIKVDQLTDYVESNKKVFTKIDFSIITNSTKEAAEETINNLKADPAAFGDELAASTDSYKSTGGKLTAVYLHELEAALDIDNTDKLLALAKDEFFGPIKTNQGYSVLRCNAEAVAADIANTNDFDHIKQYIQENDIDILKTILSELAKEYSEKATADFDAAAAEYGITDKIAEENNIPVAYNNAFSNLQQDIPKIMEFSASNEELLNKIFSANEGDVVGPVEDNGTFYIVKVGTSDNIERTFDEASLSSRIKGLYATQMSKDLK